MEQIFADAGNRMEKAVEAVRREFAKIRTGKATVSLLDGVKVEYLREFGSPETGGEHQCP